MSEAPVSVSVIIVTHNSLPALTDCLSSLAVAMPPVGGELIVVDNGSTDGSIAAVGGRFPQATIIENGANRGFAYGCNRGAEVASGEWLAFVNPDVVVEGDALVKLLEAARARERPGLIGGRLSHPDGSFQSTSRHFPTLANLWASRGSILARLFGVKRTSYTLPDMDETTAVPATALTLAMIRRDLFGDIGGLDERYFLFVEDTDLSYRLDRRGFVNLLVPAARGVHRWGRGSRVGRLRREWHHHVSLWQYFRIHGPRSAAFTFLPLLLLVHYILVMMLSPFESGRG